MGDLQALPQPQAGLCGPEVSCSLVHTLYHGSADGNNLDMPPKHPDLRSDRSNSSLSTWVHHGSADKNNLNMPPSTQPSEAIVVAPPFQPGHVYQLEDWGLNLLDPQHTHLPGIPMIHMSILSLEDLSTGDLTVATPLYHLLKEVSVSHTMSLAIPVCFTHYEHQH